MQSHALGMVRAAGPETARAKRPLLTLGAVAAVLLLTTACEGTKEFACKSSAALDNMFGTAPSAERTEDCGPQAGQAARTGSAKQAARPAGPQSDRATLADLQARLKGLGYDPGPADGQMGPKTRAAIRAYQKDAGIKADGQVTASLIRRIKAE